MKLPTLITLCSSFILVTIVTVDGEPVRQPHWDPFPTPSSIPAPAGMTSPVSTDPTNEESYPFFVAIVDKTLGRPRPFKGASLIDPTHILTDVAQINYITDTLGSGGVFEAWIGYSDSKSTGQQIPIAATTPVHIHPAYNKTYGFNNIVIIELSSPATVPPVCIGMGKSYDNRAVSFLGFGALGCSLVNVDYVHVDTGTVFDQTTCQQMRLTDLTQLYTYPDQMCASLVDSQGQPVQRRVADIGGPLILKNEEGNKKYTQVGLFNSFATWSNGCSKLSFPGRYTRLGAFKEFIEEVAPQAQFCDE